MADEITVTMGMKVTNGNLSFVVPNVTKKFNQTTARAGGPGTVDVGTSESTIDFGDVEPGQFQMQNLDDTNYVQYGFATGVYVGRLLADGGLMGMYLESGTTVYVKANTAACKIQVQAINS